MKNKFAWTRMKERALDVTRDFYTEQGRGWDFCFPQKMTEHLLLMFALERLCKQMNIDVGEYLGESSELLICVNCPRTCGGLCIKHKKDPYWQRKVIEECK